MTLIKWTADLNLGVPEMDVHHQHLVALVNTLYDMFQRGQHGHALLPVFGQLVEAAYSHFESEEEFLEKQHFPGIEDHRTEHGVLMEKLLELEGQLKNGRRSVDAELFDYLCDWLVDHIVHADKEFATFVRGAAV